MMNISGKLGTALAVSLLLFFAVAPHAEAVQCAQCGMTVDPASKFCARMLVNEQTLQFCDIGDLLTYINKKSLSPSFAEVKDYTSGEWIRADRAFYVHAEKAFQTPMGWGIAAFKTKLDAAAFGAPLDITDILNAVK